MDDISAQGPALPSEIEARRWPIRAAQWAGVGVLCAMTFAVLIPPVGYAWLLARNNTMDWQTNHAQHIAAARIAMLIILFAGGGAALGALPTLFPRRMVSAAARAGAMAAGAFAASLVLTIGGFLWILSHYQVPS